MPVGSRSRVDPAGLRQEAARILGVEPHLDRMTTRLERGTTQRLAVRDPELLFDEVDAGDRLGDGMLDLDAPVQLEEEEVAALEHELRRAGVHVADRLREPDRSVAHARAQIGVERDRRRFLEHLLVAALHRALALAECDTVPCLSASSWISTWRGRSR